MGSKAKRSTADPIAHHVAYLLHLAQQASTQSSPHLSRHYVERAMDVSRRHVYRWTPALKSNVCKKCKAYIGQPSNSRHMDVYCACSPSVPDTSSGGNNSQTTGHSCDQTCMRVALTCLHCNYTRTFSATTWTDFNAVKTS